MLKYFNYDIVFQEIPDETTLAINISGCPNKCPDCHSKFLWEDIGKELTTHTLKQLLDKYPNVTCVALMGGDQNVKSVWYLAASLYGVFNVKVAWYSGRTKIPKWELGDDYILYGLKPFNYIKLGPYIEEFGPLTSPTTNQRLYKVEGNRLVDITYKFWNGERI